MRITGCHVKNKQSSASFGALTYRVLACFLATVLLATSPLRAEEARDETREQERAVSDNPRQVLLNAELQLVAANKSDNKAGQLRALRLLAMAHDEIEDYTKLREYAPRGLALARELKDPAAVCQFMGYDAFLATNDGNFSDAATRYVDAINFAEQNQLPTCQHKLTLGKADMLMQLGHDAEALALAQVAYNYFEKRKETLLMVSALTTIAGADIGDPADPKSSSKSVQYYERALKLLDEKSNRFELGTTYHNLAVAHARLKEYAKARTYLDKGMAIARELKDPVSEAFLYYRLAILARDEGRHADALLDLDRALPTLEQTENLNMALLVHVARTRALAQLDRKAESLQALGKARILADKLKTPKTDIAYYKASSEVYAKFGDHQRAYQEVNALRGAEERRAELSNAALTSELQSRFEAKQKDTENNLLRAQAQASDARRWALVLALTLSLIVVSGLGVVLIRNLRNNKQLAILAMRDDLTNLPNRRSILQFAHMQMRQRRASDGGICVAVLDIDHFKNVNDDLGHDKGDAVLIAFASTCQKQLRSNDRIGRFGGEEFLLVMPGFNVDQIDVLFDRIRSAVKEIRIDGVPANRWFSFSMGVAVTDSDQDTVESLIKRADEALYRAKQGGRDRYELSERRLVGTPKTGASSAKETAWVSSPEHQALLKYEAILNNASVGIAFTRNRIFQHANPAFDDMFKWPRGSLVGQPGAVVWGSAEDYEEMGRIVGPLLGDGKSIEIERKMMRRDGELFWCRLQARPIDATDPMQGGTIWIIEDETERRTAIEKLQALNETLERRLRTHERTGSDTMHD